MCVGVGGGGVRITLNLLWAPRQVWSNCPRLLCGALFPFHGCVRIYHVRSDSSTQMYCMCMCVVLGSVKTLTCYLVYIGGHNFCYKHLYTPMVSLSHTNFSTCTHTTYSLFFSGPVHPKRLHLILFYCFSTFSLCLDSLSLRSNCC